MKISMKLVLTALAAAVIGSMLLYGCGSGGSSDAGAAPSTIPSSAAANIVAEPPSAVQPVTTPGTASPQSISGVPSTDFETLPGVGSTRRGP